MDNHNYSFRTKVMTRYGKLAFSEDTIQCLSLTENTYARRAPGNTCMSALHCITMPNSAPVINDSKGCGAARAAVNKFGAIMGQSVGLQGQSYAIPTMQGEVDTIKAVA